MPMKNGAYKFLNKCIGKLETEKDKFEFVLTLSQYMNEMSDKSKNVIQAVVEDYFMPKNEYGASNEELAETRQAMLNESVQSVGSEDQKNPTIDQDMTFAYQAAKEEVRELLNSYKKKNEQQEVKRKQQDSEKKNAVTDKEPKKDSASITDEVNRKETTNDGSVTNTGTGSNNNIRNNAIKSEQFNNNLDNIPTDINNKEIKENKENEENIQIRPNRTKVPDYDDISSTGVQNKKPMTFLERLLNWFREDLVDKKEFADQDQIDIYNFMTDLRVGKENEKLINDAVGRLDRPKESDERTLVEKGETIRTWLSEVKKNLEKSNKMFQDLCKSNGDDIADKSFKTGTDPKKALAELFDTCFNYENGQYSFKGGNLDSIREKINSACEVLDEYLKNKKPTKMEKLLDLPKVNRYNTIKTIRGSLDALCGLNNIANNLIDWDNSSIDQNGNLKETDVRYDRRMESRKDELQKGNAKTEKNKKNEVRSRSPRIADVNIEKNNSSRAETVRAFKQVIMDKKNKEVENKVTKDKIIDEFRQDDTAKKDEWANLTSGEREKRRKENAAREFYGNYKGFLRDQKTEKQKATALKTINSNNVADLNKLLTKIGDAYQQDKAIAELRNYVNYRKDKLNKINEAISNAEKNMQNRNVGEFKKNKEKGTTTYMVDNVRQPEVQRTDNGCWSVVLSTLLKHRGVELDQSEIRAYRPDVDVFSDDIDNANKDTRNTISSYTDLIQSVLPNTAVNDVTYSYTKNAPSSEDDAAASQDLQNALKETIAKAMEQGKGPVALLCGKHYRTVYGMKVDGNDVTVQYWDPYDFEKKEEKLEKFAESACETDCKIDAEDEKGVENPQILSKKYMFQAHWLQDLKNEKGEVNLNDTLTKKISYDGEGKLKLEKGTDELHGSNVHSYIGLPDFTDKCNHSVYLPKQLKNIELNKKNENNREKINYKELTDKSWNDSNNALKRSKSMEIKNFGNKKGAEKGAKKN